MAYTRKTTSKKTTTATKTSTKAKTTVEETPIDMTTEFEEVEIEDVDDAIPAIKAKKEFHADDMILCRSVTVGKLCMVGATNNMVYRWMNYGDECEVEYRDLVNAVRLHSQYVYTPYFIIEDEDFVNEFLELKKFYNEKFTIKELTDILAMDEDDMRDAISILPKGAKEQFINIASTKIASGELDSLKKIKALEKILDVDFSLVAEMK